MKLSVEVVKTMFDQLRRTFNPELMLSEENARMFHLILSNHVSEEVFMAACQEWLASRKEMPSILEFIEMCKSCSKKQKAAEAAREAAQEAEITSSKAIFCEYGSKVIRISHSGHLDREVLLPEDCELSASLCSNVRTDFKDSLEKSIFYEKTRKSIENSLNLYGMRLCEWHSDVVYAAIYPRSNTACLVKRILGHVETPIDDEAMNPIPGVQSSFKSLKNFIPGHLGL